MTFDCADARARWEEYLAERLPEEARRQVRNHLAGCPLCQEHAAGFEPALLFATLPPAEVSSEEMDRILSGVRAGIALKKAESRLGAPRPRRRIRAWASSAAVLALLLAMPGTPARRQAPRRLAGAGPAPAVPGAPGSFVPAAQPTVDRKIPASATIYDWNPGGGEPRVVWIVDRSLDI